MGAGRGVPNWQGPTPGLPKPSGGMADVSAVRADRSQSLAEIFRNHHQALVRFLTLRTGSREDAKDILQEAYAKLLALDHPGTISILGGYLWQTAVNLAVDRVRQRALHERYARAARQRVETRDFSAETTVEARERLAIVERAIGNLPARCLEAFRLHVLNDLTFEQVGREMQISDRMAKKHVARALEYLQACLDAANAVRIRR